MCGFIGFWGTPELPGERRQLATRMTNQLVHRGPDDSGVYCDDHSSLTLGFRRLAIIDTSEHGHQPMTSMRSRYVLVLNGEVYNAIDIRAALESQKGPMPFRGHSDTEVFLAAIEHWGIETAVKQATGMFAFAVWDTVEQRLTLGRDRFGEKPLYYGMANGALLFGSELKALVVHPDCCREIDRDALTLYMRHGYIPDPYCIYRKFRKLTPGCTLSFSQQDIQYRVVPEPIPYWSAAEACEQGREQPFEGRTDDAVDELETLLRATVSRQMLSDVPLGAFLSGGIDSSLVVALMQSQSSRPIKTFTIGFDEPRFNEAEHAAHVARHLGTEHTEMYVTSEEARDVVPLLPHLYDEPFADSSQIPTFLVSRLARQHVTVCLTGDGGDEMFGGYSRYQKVDRYWRIAHWIPSPIRFLAGRLIQNVAALSSGSRGSLSRKLDAAAQAISSARFSHVYRTSVSSLRNPVQFVRNGSDPVTAFDTTSIERHSSLRQMMLLDMLTYLPGDILTKVDRATMGVSLESRAPFLDHHIAEFACRLPANMLVQGSAGKWVLRRLLDRYVPRQLVERPKQGFAVPINEWLRGPLRPWAEELIRPAALRDQGFFDEGIVQSLWTRHQSGELISGPQLWSILMFQCWLTNQSMSASIGIAA